MRHLFILLLSALTTLPASAAMLFNNGLPDPNAGAVASNFANHDPEYELHSADDFVLPRRSRIYRIVWWGEYQGRNVPLNPDLFTIRIFPDNGGVPALFPAAEYHPRHVTRHRTRQKSTGFDIYRYMLLLRPQPRLGAGTYWVSILNNVEVEEVGIDWLWILANNSAGNYSYRFSDGTGWQTNHPFTLAFQLFGVSAPRDR